MSRTPPARAFAAAAAGIAVYSCMDALMKGLSIASGAYSAVLWRSVAGAAITAVPFVVRRTRWPRGAFLWLHVARGLAAGFSVLLFFWGLTRVTMAQGIALTFLTPLLAQFLAAATLGERLRKGAVGGSALAIGGVLVIAGGQAAARPPDALWWGMGAIVVASLLYAVNLVLLRRQAQSADPVEVTLFTSLVIGVVLLAGAPRFASLPAMDQVPKIAGAAALGTVSSLFIAWAYARAEAQLLTTVEYTAFIWSALLGYLVFGERVSLFTIGGAGLIVAGCLYAVRSAPVPVAQSEAGA